MKPVEARITPKTGADIRAAPARGRGVAHCLPPDHRGICVILLCSVALMLSAGLVNATDIDASSFRCITKMTPVRQFYVDNLQGNLDATLAATNSTTGTMYPPGSVIQLIPGEAMVKRDKGFNSATHDWEFFELDVSKDGTQIRKRGTVDVVNRFGGNCFSCHVPAAAQWDLVCETDHGCAPLPVTRAMIRALQRTDPRCGDQPVSPEDAEALRTGGGTD